MTMQVNEDYKVFVNNANNTQYAVRILTGEFKDVFVTFDSIKFTEENDGFLKMNYSYDVLSFSSDEQEIETKENEETMIRLDMVVGDIITNILNIALEESKLRVDTVNE